MVEPLQTIHRPWVENGRERRPAVCPTCRSAFTFHPSEGKRFKHKDRGDCIKLSCPCCGHEMAQEFPMTKHGS